MEDQEIIPALKLGGEARSDALKTIFKHQLIRNAVLKKLNTYKGKLSNQFPKVEVRILDNSKSYIESYLDYFFLQAIIELDKNIRRDTFRGGSFGELVNFLSATSNFKCIEWLRKSKSNSPLDPVDDLSIVNKDQASVERGESNWWMQADNVEKNQIHRDGLKILLGLLKKLGKSCREILLLDAYGYKNEEIRKKLNYSLNSVKAKKSACRRNLEKMIKENDELKDLFGAFMKRK